MQIQTACLFTQSESDVVAQVSVMTPTRRTPPRMVTTIVALVKFHIISSGDNGGKLFTHVQEVRQPLWSLLPGPEQQSQGSRSLQKQVELEKYLGGSRPDWNCSAGAADSWTTGRSSITNKHSYDYYFFSLNMNNGRKLVKDNGSKKVDNFGWVKMYVRPG